MRRYAIPVIVALLLAGCDSDYDPHVHINITASETIIAEGDVASVHAHVTTKDGPEIWSEEWFIHSGDTDHVYLWTPWDRFTNVQFFEEGTYTLTYIVEWTDYKGDWRVTQRTITFDVVEASSG